MKICPKCRKELPIEEFGVSRKRKNGISCWCKECCRTSTNNYRRTEEGKIKHNSREKKRYLENTEKMKLRARDAYKRTDKEKNRKRALIYHKNRMICPVYRLWQTMRQNIWYTKNKAKGVAKTRRRQASQLQATPKWLSSIQNAQLQEVYEISIALSMQTGVKHHVDHIHALQGKNFCGLHVPWNLKAIPAFENCSRGNKMPAEYFYLMWGEL